MRPDSCESDPDFELVTLKSGQRSIRSTRHGETMHVGTGPRSEALALHLEQQRIPDRVRESGGAGRPFILWDVGLGPAGNALTALELLREVNDPVQIHSFEIDTRILAFALRHSGELGYLAGWEAAVETLMARGVAHPLPHVRWELHLGDYAERLADAPPPNAIFHDPYSPAKNPAMWSVETFEAARRRTLAPGAPPCLLTNYTRSTAVRVTLALAGWFVGIGAPTGEKTETTVAATHVELLERPLGRDWLKRVRASANAAPLRGGAYALYAPGQILPADLERLEALPQFA